MKRRLALLVVAAAALGAQDRPVPPTKPVTPAPSASTPPTPVPAQPPATQALKARPASVVPSYRDLKFPPLGAIPIPKVDSFTLPNGIKLYLLEDHELPVVNGLALVRTGNLFDPPEKVGLATLTGMAMRTGGTQANTGEQLDEQLENLAASVESGIGETSGSVSFSALKESAGEVIAAFKDVLTSPEFPQDKIDLAKMQMRSSIARRNDDPQAIAQREFNDIVYGRDTPYGWREEYATIDNISRADLQDFYKRYFFPKNTMIAIWGDIDAAAMKARIEKRFADWTVEQPPVPEFPKVANTSAADTYLAVKKDVTQTFFEIGQLGGEYRDNNYPALVIMADILGGGFQSRLVRRIRSEMGAAYDVSADWGGNYDHPGLFEIAGSTKSLSTVETIKAIQEEVERIRTTEVTEEELTAAKAAALNGLVFAFDTKAKTLQRMVTYEYYGYPQDFLQQYQKALAAVTRADVLRVARERLNPKKFTTVAVADPADFGRPLEELGVLVVPIDTKIPQPGQGPSPADPASLEKGKQLLARAQQAAGGVEQLAAVKDTSQVAEMQIEAAGGGTLKITERWIAPNHLRQESVSSHGGITVYSDGKTGWIATAQGSQALAGAALKQVQGSLFRLYCQMLLSDRIPGRTVNATGADAVEISDADGRAAEWVFDTATGLPRKERYETVNSKGQPVSVEEEYADFRETGGLKVPFRITITQGGQKYAAVTVTDYRVNTGLKPQELGRRP